MKTSFSNIPLFTLSKHLHTPYKASYKKILKCDVSCGRPIKKLTLWSIKLEISLFPSGCKCEGRPELGWTFQGYLEPRRHHL